VNRIVNTAETKGYVHDAERPWLAIDGKHVVGRFETDQEARAALRVRHDQKGEEGALVIWHDAGPDDPMYKEGYRSYSPHWARPYHGSKSNSPSEPVERPTQAEANNAAEQSKAPKAKPRKRARRESARK
jgi:hypothetical protein